MKKEIIFRALYMGQPVFVRKDWTGSLAEVNCVNITNNGYLVLRSISQLKDEEVVTLAKLMGIFDEAYGIGYYRREIAAYIAGDLRYIGYYGTALAITDYLRSIGILIPYMGHSVDDILTLGWAKIKEDGV